MGEVKEVPPKTEQKTESRSGAGRSTDVSGREREKPPAQGPRGETQEKGGSQQQGRGEGGSGGDGKPKSGPGGDRGSGERLKGGGEQRNQGQRGESGERPKEGSGEQKDKGPRKPEYDVSKKDGSRTPADYRQKPDRTEKTQEKQAAKPKEAPKPKELGPAALEIIKQAQDKSKPPKERAENAVRQILEKFYGQKGIKVEYNKSEPGLGTRGLEAIKVGDNFLNGVDKRNFARRVVQVGHELQHRQQYRDGMTGQNRQNEREFLANSWSARAQEKPGTGAMKPGMRADYANEALERYDQMVKDKTYQNLPQETKDRYRRERDDLVRYRDEQQKLR